LFLVLLKAADSTGDSKAPAIEAAARSGNQRQPREYQRIAGH
jgi:hypothetical protein